MSKGEGETAYWCQ